MGEVAVVAELSEDGAVQAQRPDDPGGGQVKDRPDGLDRPIFAQFCNYGHFTHQDAPWEQTNFAATLVSVCGLKKYSER